MADGLLNLPPTSSPQKTVQLRNAFTLYFLNFSSGAEGPSQLNCQRILRSGYMFFMTTRIPLNPLCVRADTNQPTAAVRLHVAVDLHVSARPAQVNLVHPAGRVTLSEQIGAVMHWHGRWPLQTWIFTNKVCKI